MLHPNYNYVFCMIAISFGSQFDLEIYQEKQLPGTGGEIELALYSSEQYSLRSLAQLDSMGFKQPEQPGLPPHLLMQNIF